MSGQVTSLAAGAILHGTYQLEAPLGRGGMGSVWKARHLRLPRTVAIKVLNEQVEGSDEMLRRFRREAEITSRLGHPHIVEVFDFNQLDDGRSYLVMELLQGTSLRHRMRLGPPLRLDEVIRLLDQVASALAHAHRAGVIHRDLKPENVFLVDTGETGSLHAKVLDFGISKLQGAQTVLTNGPSLMGTPRYMSPEQAQADQEVDARADQFALGAMGYELLVGKPAFSGETVTQVLLQVLQSTPPPIAQLAAGVPTSLAAAVDRALAKNREERFPDLDQFRAAIADLTSTRSSPHLPPPPVMREDSDRGMMPWVGAVVAVGLLGGLGYALWAGGDPVAQPLGIDAGPTELASARDAGGAETGEAGGGALAVAEPDGGASEEEAPDAGTVTASDSGSRRRVVRPRPKDPFLAGAERHLRAGDADAAIVLARRAIREDRDDGRAWVTLAVAFCVKRDLGQVRGIMRNLSRAERRAVLRQCARFGYRIR